MSGLIEQNVCGFCVFILVACSFSSDELVIIIFMSLNCLFTIVVSKDIFNIVLSIVIILLAMFRLYIFFVYASDGHFLQRALLYIGKTYIFAFVLDFRSFALIW